MRKATTLLSLLTVGSIALACTAEDPFKASPLTASAVGTTILKNDGSNISEIVVSWINVHDTVRQLDLERSVDGGSLDRLKELKSSDPNKKVADVSYTDTAVSPGKTYQYALSAYDKDNKKLGVTAKTEVISLPSTAQLAAPAFSAPAANSEFSRNDTITFSWAPVSGAHLYYLHIYKTSGSDLVYGAITSDTSLVLDGGAPAPSPVKQPQGMAYLKVKTDTGLSNATRYHAVVSAIKVDPASNDFTGAKSVAVHESAQLKFDTK